jgi:hypothetical protein
LCFDGYVSSDYEQKLRDFRGVKIISVQDEYDCTDALKAAISRLGFDIVLTCVPQDSLEYVYPHSQFPDTRFLTVFTGYVPEGFESSRPPLIPLERRPIPIGYRGRDIGGRYGRLGFDKFEIGRRMREICIERGIACDIATDEASRIYGMDWFRFVGDCRAMLGSESGSNVFDFDGSLAARFREMTEASGGIPPTYAEFLPYVAERDAAIEMGQISPRIFECALMRTPMVLFRGRYSDVIEPDKHYIMLEKDFSNVDDVLARLENLPALEAMTDRAYRHLVASGAFGYPAFLERVFSAVGDLLRERGRGPVVRQAFQPDPTPSLEVRDWKPIEHPSGSPGSAADFQMRADLQEVALYRGEACRLFDEFERLKSVYLQEAVRLRNAYDALYQRDDANGGGAEGAAGRLDSEAFDFARLFPDVTSSRNQLEDALDGLAGRISAGLSAAQFEPVRVQARQARDIAKAAYDSAQSNLVSVNGACTERISRIQAVISMLSERTGIAPFSNVRSVGFMRLGGLSGLRRRLQTFLLRR